MYSEGQPILKRHYLNIHASDQKQTFPCDYTKCSRSKDSFTRKDHNIDHLHTFHKEDIGSAKGHGKVRKDKQEYAMLVDNWLANINMKLGIGGVPDAWFW